MCLWLLGAFNGTGYGFYNSESNYASLPYPFSLTNDNTWSFYNNGLAGAVDDVRFYRESGLSGDQFVLCRGDAISDYHRTGIFPRSRGTRDEGGETLSRVTRGRLLLNTFLNRRSRG